MYAAKLDADSKTYTPSKVASAPGQVIVKESWVAETATDKDPISKIIEGPKGQRLKAGDRGATLRLRPGD